MGRWVQDCERTAVKNAMRMLGMAVDMLEAVKQVQHPKTGKPIQMRIGIHTGSIVAGAMGCARVCGAVSVCTRVCVCVGGGGSCARAVGC